MILATLFSRQQYWQHLIESFPSGSADKESACNAGDLGSTPRLGRSPGGGKINVSTKVKNKAFVSRDAKRSGSSRLKKRRRRTQQEYRQRSKRTFSKEGIHLAIERVKRGSGQLLPKCQLKPRWGITSHPSDSPPIDLQRLNAARARGTGNSPTLWARKEMGACGHKKTSMDIP